MYGILDWKWRHGFKYKFYSLNCMSSPALGFFWDYYHLKKSLDRSIKFGVRLGRRKYGVLISRTANFG